MAGDESQPVRPTLPAPFPSPPFPGSDYLGVPLVGVTDSERLPLMRTLDDTWIGGKLDRRRIRITGWVDASVNASTSRDSNLPDAFDTRANAPALQQVVLRVERVPDTVQRERIDYGFRFDNLYGQDYRYTTARGIFSDQLLERDQRHGYDPVMFFGELYLPDVAEGMVLKLGRFILLPGIEAEVSPYNYLFSHSLTYTYFPYTHTGLLATTALNKRWTIQVGLTAGSDIALWDPDRELTPITGLRWVSQDNDDSIYFCTVTNRGIQTYNNVQMFNTVWTHRFNNRVHALTEAYYAYIRRVPGFGWTDWYAASNYLEILLSDRTYLSVRNEFFNDLRGQRTGFESRYTTHTLGIVHKPHDWLYLRPEIKYSRSHDLAAYDEGVKSSQIVAAFDVVLRF